MAAKLCSALLAISTSHVMMAPKLCPFSVHCAHFPLPLASIVFSKTRLKK